MVTAEQLKRTEREYQGIAGEPVKVQVIAGTLYAFGSEVATLRLFRKMPNMRQGFSDNLNSFYFSVDLPAC